MEDKKGHIKGVPFIDTPEASKNKASPPPSIPIGDTALLRARCMHLQQQITCLRRQQSWTFSLTLTSIIISVVILATKAFT